MFWDMGARLMSPKKPTDGAQTDEQTGTPARRQRRGFRVRSPFTRHNRVLVEKARVPHTPLHARVNGEEVSVASERSPGRWDTQYHDSGVNSPDPDRSPTETHSSVRLERKNADYGYEFTPKQQDRERARKVLRDLRDAAKGRKRIISDEGMTLVFT